MALAILSLLASQDVLRVAMLGMQQATEMEGRTGALLFIGMCRQVGAVLMTEFLTLTEAAALLRIEPGTLSNKMRSGVIPRGKVWFRREGEIHALFDQDELVKWVKEGSGEPKGIPMAKGYTAGT